MKQQATILDLVEAWLEGNQELVCAYTEQLLECIQSNELLSEDVRGNGVRALQRVLASQKKKRIYPVSTKEIFTPIHNQQEQRTVQPLTHYHQYVDQWFAKSDHLHEIDHQVDMHSYPKPVALLWTQWDSVYMPNRARISLQTNVYVGNNRSASYATCAIFDQSRWYEVARMESTSMQTVQLFGDQKIGRMQEQEIQSDEQTLRAFRQDIERIRAMALQILTMGYLPRAPIAPELLSDAE